MGFLLRWLSMGFLVRPGKKSPLKKQRLATCSMIALGMMCGFALVGWVENAFAWQNLQAATCGFHWSVMGHNPCPQHWGGACDIGYEIGCLNGVKVQNSEFYYRQNGMCWSGGQFVECPAEGDACTCGGSSCTGSCGYYVMNGQVMPASNNCSNGCECPPASEFAGFPDGYYSRDCRRSVGTCGGTAYWFSVQNNGVSSWTLSSTTCAGGTSCYPVCPSWAPNGGGETTETGCSSTMTPGCPTRTVSCSGSCTYVSVATGQGGFTWALQSSNCTVGASNCACPSGPGGQCPNEAGVTTTVSCGATGGTCTPGPCSGSCNYTSVSDGNGGFRWSLGTSNCTAGANNCTCPADPGGDCPKALRDTKIVSCGSTGTPCKKGDCDARGGDADNDGCCKDDDIDDDDAAVCAADCKGAYTLCTTYLLTDETKKIPCDPATWSSPTGYADCTCQRLQNGDRDKDKCCDAVDKWPDDPKRGCPCCDYEQAWTDAGGELLYAQYVRIFGYRGPASQFISYNRTYDRFDMTGPTGTPDMVYVTLPVNTLTGGISSDYTMPIPLTIPQLESVVNSLGVGTYTGAWSAADTARLWFRSTLAWLVAASLLTILFQEFRV